MQRIACGDMLSSSRTVRVKIHRKSENPARSMQNAVAGSVFLGSRSLTVNIFS
jgi:hypothetical protein